MPLIAIILTLSSFLSPEAHDFHVSKCLVEYNEEQAALQISLHLFIDDLEDALSRRGHDQLFICTKRESELADSLIHQYLADRLQLKVNNSKAQFQFIGKEISDDLMAAWCYLEITGVQELNQLEVSNRILLEVFDDQKNILSVTGPSHQATLLFQRGQERKKVKF